MPKVVESFEVDQPVARVWAFFQDVPQVVTCMPGLTLTGQTGENTYQGKITVKLGPIASEFEGEATIVETDEAAHRVRIESKGIDKRGGSRASATVAYALSAKEGGGTAVAVEGDIKLTGALAQMGRTGIVQDIAKQLIGEFSAALGAKLAAASPEEAAQVEPRELRGERLFLIVLWRGLLRALGSLFGARREN